MLTCVPRDITIHLEQRRANHIAYTNTNYERLNKSNETLLSVPIIVAGFYIYRRRQKHTYFFFIFAFKCHAVDVGVAWWRVRVVEKATSISMPIWNRVRCIVMHVTNVIKSSTVIKSNDFWLRFKLIRHLWHFYSYIMLFLCLNDDVNATKSLIP